VIEPRIYRVAFVPALLAVVLAMFSLESRPRPLGQALAADVVFEGPQAAASTRAVLAAARDRRAGSRGDLAAARLVAGRFRARGFEVEADRFEHDAKQLVNVIGRRAGKSRRQLVVVAPRDAAGVPDASGSAADTAALLEIARVFEGRPSEKTLVLASVDGSALGEGGTTRLAEALGDPALIDGVIVLSGLATGSGPPRLETWSNDTTTAGIGLRRTVAESLRQEVGSVAGRPSVAGQLARLAFPIGIGGQGPLLAAGLDAVRISGDDRPPGASPGGELDERRFEALGRALLRSVAALDGGGTPERGPAGHVIVAGQVMPGWVLSVLALALLFPALVGSVDAFARARRRREPVGALMLWLAAGVAPFAIGLTLVYALVLTGAVPAPPQAPVAPERFPLGGAEAAALGLVSATVGLAWIGLRLLVLRAYPGLADRALPGAGVVVSLVLALAALVLWLINPYAALILAPAVHLWMLATLLEPPPPRKLALALVALGLLLPGLVVLYDALALAVGPLGGAWYLLLLVAGGHVGLPLVLVGCVLAGVLGSVVSIAVSKPPEGAGSVPDTHSVRGPAGYAGPGSLGGTTSALPRR